MRYQIIQPSVHLQSFIKDYLLFYAVFDKKDPAPVKPFPATTHHSMVFYLRGDITAVKTATGQSKKFDRIVINAVQVSNFNFHLSSEYLMLSVNFQPGALSKFLQMPLTAFMDERIDAEAILNPGIKELYEQMSNAMINENIIQLVETYLWKRIKNISTNLQPIDKISLLMTMHPGVYSIEQLAGHACLSISQFERRFMKQEGITPKLFDRINRFSSACLLKNLQPNLDWLYPGEPAVFYLAS
ncbi:MAG: DUF6597 domain-containing transcriptional factor [Ferruginibacter sp.]